MVDPEPPRSPRLASVSCFFCHLLCSEISSSSWHLVCRIRESHFLRTSEMTIREKNGSSFQTVMNEMFFWVSREAVLRKETWEGASLQRPHFPRMGLKPLSLEWLRGHPAFQRADGRHYLTPRFVNRFAPRGWNCPRVLLWNLICFAWINSGVLRKPNLKDEKW